MPQLRESRRPAFGLLLCGVAALSAAETEAPQDPERAFAAARQATESQAPGRIAREYNYEYRVEFDDSGVAVAPLAADTSRSSSWNLGLRLAGYGTPAEVEPVADAEIAVVGTRLEYRRGAITEWYEAKPAGLEQGFTLHAAPTPGASEVVLALAVEGGLRGEWERAGQSVGFVTAAGDPVLSYGELRVIDANGKPAPARLALGPDRVEIHVQVGDAQWPVIVDPLIAEPGEPILDWVAPDYVLSDTEHSAQIPIRWRRYYGERALIAQYWLDDELVLTRAVHDEDDQSGSATLQIDEGGEYTITVALCNTDGCSAADPLVVTVIDPEQPLRTEADAGGDAGMLSHEEAARIVQESAARLGIDRQPPLQRSAVAESTWGEWFASLVGQAALKYGLSLGFDALITHIGLGQSGPDLGAELSAIGESLGEIQTQLDDIADKIDVGKADSDFKNSHRDAKQAMTNLKTIASNIKGIEAGTEDPTQYQLESWAKDNRNNIAALQTLLVDPLTGAVPLLLDYYQLKYPVSTGIEVRDQIDGYLNGFRAALGIGLMNQAWLTEAFTPNGVYDEGAEEDARATVVAAYDLSGAPYPQPPSGPPGFIHRIGTTWAMVDLARPELEGESVRAMTQERNEVWDLFTDIATATKAPGELTIRDYMNFHEVKRVFNDPSSVRIDHRDSFFECELWVRHDEFYVGPDRAHQNTLTTYNRKYACSFGAAKPRREAEAQEAYLKETFWANEKIYTVDVPMNAWGMPALMEERAIDGYRDGIDIESVNRAEGNAVTVTYDANGYDWIQLADPEEGTVLFTGANQDRTLNLSAPSGAVEIVQGYRIEDRDGDNSMQPMERAIVTANSGAAIINLTLDP